MSAIIICESRTLQKFGGGFEYRVVATSPDDFVYEVKGSIDAMGIESWIAADNVQRVDIRSDLTESYLRDLYLSACTQQSHA